MWQNTTLGASAESAPERWLGARLVGRGAHGARLELSYEVDGERRVRSAYAMTAGGFQASGPLMCHLVADGCAVGVDATLKVSWLGGGVTELKLEDLDQWITVTRGEGVGR